MKPRKIKAWAVIAEDGYPSIQMGYEKNETSIETWYYFETFPNQFLAKKRKKAINKQDRPTYKVVPVEILLPPKK